MTSRVRVIPGNVLPRSDTDDATAQNLREVIRRIDALPSGIGGFVSLGDFHAIGDDVTDDTAAIQAALDAGLFVFFPCPEVAYRITEPLVFRDGHVLFGAGPIGVVIHSDMTDPMLEPSEAATLRVVGLTFDNTDMANTGSVALDTTDCSVLLEHVIFKNVETALDGGGEVVALAVRFTNVNIEVADGTDTLIIEEDGVIRFADGLQASPKLLFTDTGIFRDDTESLQVTHRLNVKGDLHHMGDELAFFDEPLVAQQTTPALGAYSADDESGSYTGLDNAQGGTPYAKLTDLNALRTAYENLRASHEDLLAKFEDLTDALEAYGLLTP